MESLAWSPCWPTEQPESHPGLSCTTLCLYQHAVYLQVTGIYGRRKWKRSIGNHQSCRQGPFLRKTTTNVLGNINEISPCRLLLHSSSLRPCFFFFFFFHTVWKNTKKCPGTKNRNGSVLRSISPLVSLLYLPDVASPDAPQPAANKNHTVDLRSVPAHGN